MKLDFKKTDWRGVTLLLSLVIIVLIANVLSYKSEVTRLKTENELLLDLVKLTNKYDADFCMDVLSETDSWVMLNDLYGDIDNKLDDQ